MKCIIFIAVETSVGGNHRENVVLASHLTICFRCNLIWYFCNITHLHIIFSFYYNNLLTFLFHFLSFLHCYVIFFFQLNSHCGWKNSTFL